jgi:hypothetical protein
MDLSVFIPPIENSKFRSGKKKTPVGFRLGFRMYLAVLISPIENIRFRSGKNKMPTCVRRKKDEYQHWDKTNPKKRKGN